MKEEINNLMTEFSSEISKINVSAKDLMVQKVSKQALKTEVFLRSVYGDAFGVKTKVESESSGGKVVKGISAKDINQGNEIKELVELIDKSEFNKALEFITR